eukprot:gene8580-11593_t
MNYTNALAGWIQLFFLIIVSIIFPFISCTTTSFSYTGSSQSFTVPSGVTSLIVDIRGGRGGNADSTYGGHGGCVQTTLAVTSGSVLTVVIGAAGTDSDVSSSSGDSVSNTYGGGGSQGSLYGTQGGGASYIKLVSSSAILVVAGGGGGSFSPCSSSGGQGGGLVGGSGGSTCVGSSFTAANSGSSSSGGSGAVLSSLYGSDGLGLSVSSITGGSAFSTYGGGGGGGYYGGGGGCWSGGAGGSSYTNPSYASSTTHTQGCNSGNGNATFTYTASSKTPSALPSKNPSQYSEGIGASSTIINKILNVLEVTVDKPSKTELDQIVKFDLSQDVDLFSEFISILNSYNWILSSGMIPSQSNVDSLYGNFRTSSSIHSLADGNNVSIRLPLSELEQILQLPSSSIQIPVINNSSESVTISITSIAGKLLANTTTTNPLILNISNSQLLSSPTKSNNRTTFIATLPNIATITPSTFKASSGLATAKGLQRSMTVIFMFGIYWGVGLTIVLFIFYRNKSALQLNEKKQKQLEAQFLDVNDGTVESARGILDKYFDEVIPKVFISQSILNRLINEVFGHHRFSSIINNRPKLENDAEQKYADGVKLLTTQCMMMFMMALFYDFQYPQDDGSCVKHTDEELCLNRRSPFDNSIPYCVWTSSDASSTSEYGPCQYNATTSNSLRVFIISTVLISFCTGILIRPIDLLFHYLLAPILNKDNRKERNIKTTTIDAKVAHKVASVSINKVFPEAQAKLSEYHHYIWSVRSEYHHKGLSVRSASVDESFNLRGVESFKDYAMKLAEDYDNTRDKGISYESHDKISIATNEFKNYSKNMGPEINRYYSVDGNDKKEATNRIKHDGLVRDFSFVPQIGGHKYHSQKY